MLRTLNLKEGIGTWIGKDIKTLTHHYGQADRSYPYKNGLKIMSLNRKMNIIL